MADLVAALVGRPWTDQRGETRPLTVADILIVAPYNVAAQPALHLCGREAASRGIEAGASAR